MKIHSILFLVLLIFLPSQLAFHFWPSWAHIFGIRIDYLSPTLFFTDIVFIVLLVSWLVEDRAVFSLKKYFLKHSALLTFLCLFVLINILTATLPFLSLYKWFRLIQILLLFLYIKKNTIQISSPFVGESFAIATIWTSILSILQVATGHSMGGFWKLLGERPLSVSSPGIALQTINGIEYLRPYATLPHPNALAGVLFIVIVLIFPLHRKLLVRVALLLGSIILFLTGSQALYVALFFSLLSLLVKIKVISRTFVLSVIFVLTTSLLAVLLAPSLDTTGVSKSVVERINLLVASGPLLAEHWLLGLGLGNSILYAPRLLLQPVHSVFVLIFLEIGFLGILIGLFLLSRIKNIELSRQQSVILIALLVTGFIDHYWLTLLQPGLFLCITWALLSNSNNRK